MKEELSKKEAALQATLKLIAEQGFHAAPMSKIAERANLGVGTIYRYFKNKEELINEVYFEIKRQMAQRIVSHQDTTASTKQQISQYIKDFINYSIENYVIIQFTEQYENSPLLTEETRKKTDQLLTPLLDLFQQGQEEKLFKDLPFQTLFTMLSGSTVALIKLYLTNIPDENELDKAIEAMWDMIGK